MKKLILLLSIGITFAITSCKKNTTQPQTVTNTVTKTDTIKVTNTTTVTVHDTLNVVGMNLIGIWKVYQIETVQNNNSSFSTVNYNYDFTSTKLLQDLDANGTYEYQYNVTYGVSYVDIYYTATPQTHAISTAGKEYRLTSTDPSNNTVITYLRK